MILAFGTGWRISSGRIPSLRNPNETAKEPILPGRRGDWRGGGRGGCAVAARRRTGWALDGVALDGVALDRADAESGGRWTGWCWTGWVLDVVPARLKV